jgi:hypothetical protein
MVHLAEPGSDRRARIRVSLDMGRCLLAEGIELPTAASRVAAALVDVMRQLEVAPEALVLDRRGTTLAVHLRSATPRGETNLDIDPDTGLLLAARLRLPIMVTVEAAATDASKDAEEAGGDHASVPAAFRDFLATLPLDDDD